MNYDLLKEFVGVIDKDIVVNMINPRYYENDFLANTDDMELFVPQSFKKWFEDIRTQISAYVLIDLGFNFHNYCGYRMFSLLHELGHLVNGPIDEKVVYMTKINEILDLNMVDTQREYIQIDDEWYAWEWAYDFLKRNKSFVKRLERQLFN